MTTSNLLRNTLDCRTVVSFRILFGAHRCNSGRCAGKSIQKGGHVVAATGLAIYLDVRGRSFATATDVLESCGMAYPQYPVEICIGLIMTKEYPGSARNAMR